MQLDIFKEELTKKIYKNNNGFVIKIQNNDGGGILGTTNKGLVEPIDFDDNNIIISLTNDLKCIIPLNSECEIETDEEDGDTFVVRNRGCVYSLSFITE